MIDDVGGDLSKISLRSRLIQIVSEEFCKQNIFEPANKFDERLQKQLDVYFSFETRVSMKAEANSYYLILITFKDEEDKDRVISITIRNSVTVNDVT